MLLAIYSCGEPFLKPAESKLGPCLSTVGSYMATSIFSWALWKPDKKLCQLRHRSHVVPGPGTTGAGQDSSQVSFAVTAC